MADPRARAKQVQRKARWKNLVDYARGKGVKGPLPTRRPLTMSVKAFLAAVSGRPRGLPAGGEAHRQKVSAAAASRRRRTGGGIPSGLKKAKASAAGKRSGPSGRFNPLLSLKRSKASSLPPKLFGGRPPGRPADRRTGLPLPLKRPRKFPI
mgnify:CR=1 FL=1